MTEEIMSAITNEVYGVWFLIGAAFVFWMQARGLPSLPLSWQRQDAG